ncbi:carboxymuconolactone decarboxylase family protein [Limobrevibacterium gyesilva]|uniref:Carboxymuconolactone decarboxylase family protein n=1 Tax=Limobrevibacterium gyesilva TaxID=2991712 RepID=A0AA41YTZ2_9PROT|nr:carboxymuconolactone decarboxylase family protein [Limobrevibacterium gyesilva]MCW3475377.1 carboxymuconolactone decarboxylase family protein [Limobrevibacterium gyesilva]
MRLPIIEPEQMTPEQRRVHDDTVAGKRGRMPPPVQAWLHSPKLADRAQRLGEFVRYETSLPPALNEMAILITAKHWNSHYEWYAHRPLALAAGLDPAIIDAIRTGRDPGLTDAGARAIYDYATTLHRTRDVSQALHDAVVAAFGARGVVELVGVCGYYTLISMTLNAFDVPLPPGETSELQAPARP